jgi:hypothetical protein
MDIDGMAKIATAASPFFRVTTVTFDGSVACTQFSGTWAEDIARKRFDEVVNDVTVVFCCFIQIGGGQPTFCKAAHSKDYDPKTGQWDTDT